MNDFATLRLDGSGLKRTPFVPQAKRTEGYLDRFDADTLWLDAVWHRGAVVLVCPRLNTLARDIAGARFSLDGRDVTPRFRRYDRHTLIRLPAPERPERIAIRIDDWTGETEVHAPSSEFDGLNTLVTLSKDNHPDWIEDWARFHVHHHGAQAALFIDNGSVPHGPEAIRQALDRAGLRRVVVLSTALPYGPRGLPPFVNAELFLQTSVLNVAQFRFLQGARAVLNCDVDELVMTPGRSVFDLAAESRFGFVSFPGQWVQPAPEFETPCCHAAHSHRDSLASPCPTKWCIVPDGPLRGFQWRAHGLERLPVPGLFRARNAWFYHCRAVTNGWKSATRIKHRDGGPVPDPQLQAALGAAGLPLRSP